MEKNAKNLNEVASKMKILDLSQTICNRMPVYPSDPRVELHRVTEYDKTGYNVMSVNMGTHSGTHVDLPLHTSIDGNDAAGMPLETFFGDAVTFEISSSSGTNAAFKEVKLDTGEIKKGDILIIRTGWEEKASTPEYFSEFPYFDSTFADQLINLGVKAVGTDLPSVDGPDTKGEVHKRLLSNNIVIFEGLVNLKQLVGKRFLFYGVPMKIEMGDGSPIRAFALL